MQHIAPCLWFDNQAEEAAHFYTSIFKNSKILRLSYYGDAGAEVSGKPKGSIMTVTFQLEGQQFIALNGGPDFKFSPAISLFVSCESQEEIDDLWNNLSADGETVQCGWLQDKYGISWQIVPTILVDFLNDPDTEKSEQVMKAMLKMKKLDMQALKKAYNQ
ncbi:VOC family protein [Legionella feeleii]|uniref:DNA binding protein n=1 Tax=Legionella feeleii TaxID=453 RepID=A0A0W0THU6_9GAMM|nr:VOC family protein [Legionella feeleii]KTC95152.1 DNA binding protein [Legionella feeleii]SPX62490.1 DNA binding protein [Legionella feeleii]